MSGGSFNYLCNKDATDLLAERENSFAEMTVFLEENFPGTQAAKDTRALFERYRGLQAELDSEPLRSLRDNVWHAVEWWKSGDYSHDQAQAAVDGYRGP